MDNQTGIFFATLAVFFIAMCVAVATLTGMFSGWFALQKRYPNTDEPALLTLRRQPVIMGKGVGMSGVLKLSACPSGLRIGISRMFGLFQRSFLVPWDEITAELRTFLLLPMARLSLGRPDIGSFTIDAGNWQSLSAHSPAKARRNDSFDPVSRGQVARALLLQWGIIAVAILASALLRGPGKGPALVPLVGGLIIFGIFQLFRLTRMRF